MNYLSIILLLSAFSVDSERIDFGSNKITTWESINDGVMGGLSEGEIQFENDILKFNGNISLENNGGFASVRSRYRSKDLTDFETVSIRYRSEGQTMGFTLECYRQWYMPDYKVKLPTTNMEWTEVTFYLKDFKEFRLGRYTARVIDEDLLKQVIRLGVITMDKNEGPFQAEIDYIEFN